MTRTAPPLPPKARGRKVAVAALQVAVTVSILWFIFRDPAKRRAMFEVFAGADPLWLLCGLAAYAFVEFLAGVRWQLLLRVQSIALSWRRVFTLLFIGIFFNFFIPGGTGGDVVKVFYLLKETPGQRAPALLSVLVDRIIGVFSLVILGGLLVAARWDWLTSSPDTAKYIWLTLGLMFACLGGLGFSFLLSGFNLAHKLPLRFPGRDRLAEVALAYNLYARAWQVTLATFLISVAAHLGYFATFYCAARALATPATRLPTLGELFAIMPVINTITALPISLGGVGVREGLFQLFLGRLCQVSEAVAVVISSTGYLITMTVGLLGGLLYMLYRPSEHARLREMREKVAEFEHTVAESEIARETGQGSEVRSQKSEARDQ